MDLLSIQLAQLTTNARRGPPKRVTPQTVDRTRKDCKTCFFCNENISAKSNYMKNAVDYTIRALQKIGESNNNPATALLLLNKIYFDKTLSENCSTLNQFVTAVGSVMSNAKEDTAVTCKVEEVTDENNKLVTQVTIGNEPFKGLRKEAAETYAVLEDVNTSTENYIVDARLVP